MKKIIALLLGLCLLLGCACAQEMYSETEIVLGEEITVNGAAIGSDGAVYLAERIETHKDVPEELEGLVNRVVVIAEGGTYRVRGTAEDAQISIEAGEVDAVRLILDGVDITCRTAPAIVGRSAADSRVPGEYGITIALAAGSENRVTGSHTKKLTDDDVKLSGAITSLVSLGIEGEGSLYVDADDEGIEVKFGHLTINGGNIRIEAGDDPVNVSEDEVGVFTMNDGYLYSSVKPLSGGEGDGIDSNGYIVFNGGTAINLAHPTSGDSGVDSDMGSSINGGVVVGAGNMYDPIDADSSQLFMMLEFAEQTDRLVVVTDADDVPVFAYDFPYSYTYIAFSTPELQEGSYRVYLGGEIEGEAVDGLYTCIDSYIPGTLMSHGGEAVQGGMELGGMPPEAMGGEDDGNQPPEKPDGMPEMPDDMPEMPDNMPEMRDDMPEKPDDMPEMPDGMLEKPDDMPEKPDDMPGGMGGPRSMERSADEETTEFYLSAASTGFTNVRAAE